VAGFLLRRVETWYLYRVIKKNTIPFFEGGVSKIEGKDFFMSGYKEAFV
jgi:hypothetical protein